MFFMLPCGIMIGSRALQVSESSTGEVCRVVQEVFNTADSFPAYMMYDRACFVSNAVRPGMLHVQMSSVLVHAAMVGLVPLCGTYSSFVLTHKHLKLLR